MIPGEDSETGRAAAVLYTVDYEEVPDSEDQKKDEGN